MNIYNRIEQLAIDVVNQIFDSFDENSADERCDCEQCRLDVTCYVLNRLQPKYIISERGFTHIESEYTSQETAENNYDKWLDWFVGLSASSRKFFILTIDRV